MHRLFLMLVALFVFFQNQVFSQTIERSQVPLECAWKLEDLYDSDQTWEQAKKGWSAKFDNILKYKGKLASSASELLACLECNSEILKECGRLHSYANMKSDQDTRNSKYLAAKQELERLVTDYSSKASFIEPEIAAMDQQKIDDFITDEKGLKIYKMYLYDIQRRKAHKLSEKEEKILAEAGLLAEAPYSIFFIFSNAELPFPEIELSDGTNAKLNQAGYARLRALPNQQDRESVFQTFWSTFDKFKQTFGTQLYANINKDIFYVHTRNYKSSLEHSLDKDNIPNEVYSSLIENVNNNLDTFHRYLNLKKRMLGVDILKYSDVYAPVVRDMELKYTFDQAKKL